MALSQVLELTKKIEFVAKAVEATWADGVGSGNHVVRAKAEDYMQKFNDMILERIDLATAHLLRFADEHVNDRNELQVEEISGGLSLGLWSSYNDIRPIRKSVIFEKVGVQLDIPKQVLQHDARFIHRVIRCPLETMSYRAYHPDANKPGFVGQVEKYVVGDVIIVDILRPPAGALNIRAKKWVLRDHSSLSLNIQRCPYPSAVPCKCFVKVPEDVFMSEEVTMALWNPETQQWVQDGSITEFQYSEANRQAQFYTTAVGIFALVKDRVADLPFKFWGLGPVRAKGVPTEEDDPSTNKPSEGCARLTVQNQRHTVVIEIVGSKCRLVEPTVRQVEDLLGKYMTPGILLHRLLRKGLNVFPTVLDAPRCTLLRKPVKVGSALVPHARTACPHHTYTCHPRLQG